MPDASRRDPFLGRTLCNKYRVVAAVARGGMGRVYRAVQEPLDREVALKILDLAEHEESAAERATYAGRFLIEAKACGKLQHPNTVVLMDYGEADEDVLFIVMELLTGDTLRDVFEASAPLAPLRLVHIGVQICGSLQEAHELGMVHRDLKPENVVLASVGLDSDFVKVLDFGLVKLAGAEEVTRSGALVGTPRYIAPEQVTDSEVTPASDVYSLGAILYHGLTGTPPFDSDSKFVLLASHVNVEPAPARELQPDSPASDALIGVVMRCLRKEPAERYSSMAEVAAALLATPEGRAGTSPAAFSPRAIPEARPAAPASLRSALGLSSGLPASEPGAASRRSELLAFATVGVLIAILAAVGVALVG